MLQRRYAYFVAYRAFTGDPYAHNEMMPPFTIFRCSLGLLCNLRECVEVTDVFRTCARPRGLGDSRAG